MQPFLGSENRSTAPGIFPSLFQRVLRFVQLSSGDCGGKLRRSQDVTCKLNLVHCLSPVYVTLPTRDLKSLTRVPFWTQIVFLNTPTPSRRLLYMCASFLLPLCFLPLLAPCCKFGGSVLLACLLLPCAALLVLLILFHLLLFASLPLLL